MTKDEAINAIYTGKLINCTKEEYPEIRIELQGKASKMIDSGDGLRGMMMLEEVKRLDKMYHS